MTNADYYRELAEDCLFAAPSPNGSSAGAKLTKASIDLQRAGEGIRQDLRLGALPSCLGFAFTRKQVTFVCMKVEW